MHFILEDLGNYQRGYKIYHAPSGLSVFSITNGHKNKRVKVHNEVRLDKRKLKSIALELCDRMAAIPGSDSPDLKTDSNGLNEVRAIMQEFRESDLGFLLK